MAIDPNAPQAAAAVASQAPARTAMPVSTSPGALAPPTPAPATAPSVAPQLAAAAQHGQAGIDAYHQAKNTLASLQQNAVANAQARAKLLGGPESQGFENIANQFYDRGQANLASSNAAFQGQQAGNKQAYDQYFAGLKNDIPGINNYINTKLAQYESKKRGAYFPKDEIMGSATTELGQNQQAAATSKDALDAATARRDQNKNGEFSTPMKQIMQQGVSDLHNYDSQMRGKYGKTWDSFTFGDPGAEAALKQMAANSKGQGGAELSKAIADRNNMVKELNLHRNQYNTAYSNEQRNLVGNESDVAAKQKAFDDASQYTTPEGLAQHIATTRYGVSPEKAAGAFPASKFITPQGTQNVMDTKQYGEKAVGLSQKLNIDGGAKNVAMLLNTPQYKETVAEAQKLATAGGAKFNDVKHHIMTQYKDSPNLVKLILDEIGGYGWKKA